VRRGDGRNTGDDVKLPDATTFDAAMETSSGDRALTAAEADQRRREEFQKKLAKRVYSKPRAAGRSSRSTASRVAHVRARSGSPTRS